MLLIKSFILGLSVSAPVGLVGLLCIQRIISRGKTAGFMTGLGASSANLFYASIAALGFSIVSSFLIEQEFVLRIVGAIFLFSLYIFINDHKSCNYFKLCSNVCRTRF